jgi:hypothetical protein
MPSKSSRSRYCDRFPYKQEVTGSSPVPPTSLNRLQIGRFVHPTRLQATFPSFRLRVHQGCTPMMAGGSNARRSAPSCLGRQGTAGRTGRTCELPRLQLSAAMLERNVACRPSQTNESRRARMRVDDRYANARMTDRTCGQFRTRHGRVPFGTRLLVFRCRAVTAQLPGFVPGSTHKT